jgi:hypothetical protein
MGKWPGLCTERKSRHHLFKARIKGDEGTLGERTLEEELELELWSWTEEAAQGLA